MPKNELWQLFLHVMAIQLFFGTLLIDDIAQKRWITANNGTGHGWTGQDTAGQEMAGQDMTEVGLGRTGQDGTWQDMVGQEHIKWKEFLVY